ncbi:MAG TPA: hypothetical protein VKA32_06605 [Gammaproteobacteria bacterium]|nr:hypothetical protein [Gammaproteobacteria bacterium]
MKRHGYLYALVGMTLMLFAGASLAAGAAEQEAATAAQHAGYSAKAGSLQGQHLHLHHVVNCLVGEDGDGFDESAGNPCKGQGDGAINDAEEGSSMQMQLEQAADLASIGTEVQNSEAAKHVALAVEAILKTVGGSGQ